MTATTAVQARIERAVQVIGDRGADADKQFKGGSGHLLGGPYVLTAAHLLVEGATQVIRTAAGTQHPAVALVVASDLDVAVLEVEEPGFGADLAPAPFGLVDRHSDDPVTGCSVVGYPMFKRHIPQGASATPLRDSSHIRGEINPKANLTTRELEFRVSAVSNPGQGGRFGGQAWVGLSGAALRARYPRSEDLVVGVVTQHVVPEGSDVIRAVGVAEMAAVPALAEVLGLPAPAALPVLPFRPEREPSHYLATVADYERRTRLLLDRDDWLAYLEGFARGTVPEGSNPYVWLIGRKWSGKTALGAHFAVNAPGDIDCVSFFLGDKADADSSRYLVAVGDQLARLLGEPPDTTRSGTGGVDTYRRLWEWAARRAETHHRPLLLVVDGLDDDVSARRDLPSVASLLPRLLNGWTRVLVTSRQRPRLPADVDLSHPLFDANVRQLDQPSPTVLARTREVERRHRLCPVCKLSDEADEVPAIADAGYWAGPNQNRSFAASSAVAFPTRSTAAQQIRQFASEHLLAFGCLGVLAFWLVSGLIVGLGAWAIADEGGALFVGLLGIGAAVLWWTHWQAQARLRANARIVWNQLWYCNRDGIIYWPETGQHLTPNQLRGFLYDSGTQSAAGRFAPAPAAGPGYASGSGSPPAPSSMPGPMPLR